MQIVVADHRAAHRPVSPRIDCSRVVGLITNVVNFVELNNMIVTAEVSGRVRRIVEQVVCGAIADPVDRDAVPIHPVPPAPVVDVIVLGVEARRRERFSVASTDANAAVTRGGDVASNHSAVCATDAHSPTADVSQRAADEFVLRGPFDLNRRAAHSF